MDYILQILKDSCNECFFSTGLNSFIAYSLVIFIISLVNLKKNEIAIENDKKSISMHIADIGIISRSIGPSSLSQIFGLMLDLFKIKIYYIILSTVLKIIKFIYGINNNKLNSFNVFFRMFYFYMVVIPIPATFLLPVDYPCAKPNMHLMVALVLLIIINAIGDTISSKITVYNFTNALNEGREALLERVNDNKSYDNFWLDEIQHFKIILVIMKDLLFSAVVLMFVLGFSSVLFGIQVMEYNFSLDPETINKMIDRFLRFPEIISALYWFEDGTSGPFGYPGIPGMFIYGISTFLPTLFLFTVTILWFFILPFRILLTIPQRGPARTVLAELSVFFVCTGWNLIGSFNVIRFYGFLITKWAT